ncbi:MAG: DUF4173 domain-containing protein [Myxococcaceae bacterium]|nr:DUF4173 domain-containing protein [Myxococcaceae bacterium]MCA3014762.1 DUF4173 domain-containing protein [Myxococcaceae bacterium]
MPSAKPLEVDPAAIPFALAPRPRPARRPVVLGAAAVASAAALGLDGGPVGLGFFLTTAAAAVALAVGGGREAWQRAGAHRWLVAAALVLAGFVVVRDSELLVALDVLAVGWLLALAVRGWNGEAPLVDASLGHTLKAPASAFVASAKTGAAVTGELLRASRVGQTLPALAGPAVKVTLLALPVIGLVTLLLASGDAAFGVQLGVAVSSAVAMPLDGAARTGGVGFFAFVIAAGAVTWALRRRTLDAGQAPSALRLTLGAPEAFALLGGLTVVLALFAAVSGRCSFAPDSCQLPPGLTFSEYARRGFWELLLVAGIVLTALLSVPRRATLASAASRTALKATSTALVVAALPMLLSAVNRMMLYEAAYGFTRQRVFSQLVCVTLGLLMVWRAVTLWTWPHRFAVGAVATVSGVLVLFNAMNPDAFIARRNVERGGALDAWYLRALSADAAGVLRQVPAARLDAFHASLFASPRSAPATIASFNLARACDDVTGRGWRGPWCP